jgi:signal transduction histidine kinase/ActR/RegA family two-component response regulator
MFPHRPILRRVVSRPSSRGSGRARGPACLRRGWEGRRGRTAGARKTLLLLALALATTLFARADAPPLEEKSVLILNSYHFTYSWSTRITQELTSALTAAGVREERIVVRFFDSVRIQDTDALREKSRLLLESLRPFRFDLIITQDDYALETLGEFYETEFRGVPVVFCGVTANFPIPDAMRPHLTGAWENSAGSSPLRQILSLHPEVRDVHLLHGANPTAKAVAAMVRAETAHLPGVTFHWLDGEMLTAEEAWSAIGQIPPDSLLVSLGWKFGRDRQPDRLHDKISRESPVAAYLTDDFEDRSRHGPRLLGLNRVDAGQHAQRAAGLALRVLHGTPPTELPFDTSSRRQLFLFRSSFEASGLRLGRLPADTILREVEPSFLARHRILFLGVGGVLLGALLGHPIARRLRDRQIRRLEEERAQFHGLFQAIHEIVLLCRPDGRIVGCNEQATRVLGLTHEVLVGSPLSPIEVQGGAYLRLKLADGTMLPVEKAPVSLVRFGGEEAEMHVYHDLAQTLSQRAALEEAARELSTANGLLATALEAAESAARQAREADAAKTAFLTNVSHEIRTPLHAIVSLSEFLLAEGATARNQRDLEALRTSGLHLHSLLATVLDLSKIEAGEFALEGVPFALEEVFEDCASITRSKLRDTPVEMLLRMPGSPSPRVFGDPGRLRQVLLNLLSNAAKFTASGHVELAMQWESPTPDLIRLEAVVADTGQGIAPELLERIFEPFFQADSATNRSHEGVGIGLTISRSLVRLMGGNLSVRSEVGRGTAFTLTLNLPLAGGDAPRNLPFPTATDTAVAKAAEGPATLRALVVDDNALNRQVLDRFLRRLGADTALAESGEACLGALGQEAFDIVFMDVQMPGIDGLETTRRIRNLPAGARTRRVPVVAVTAHAMKGDRERCLAAGMDDYLSKPVSLDALAQAIKSHACRQPPSLAKRG